MLVTLDGTFAGGKHRVNLGSLRVVIALSTWVLLVCCAESGWFWVWFFHCMEVVGLRVTAVVFNHRDPHAIAVGYLYSVLSVHVGQTMKVKAGHGFLRRFVPPSPGELLWCCSNTGCAPVSGDAQGCAATAALCSLQRPSQNHRLRGMSHGDAMVSWGDPLLRESLLWCGRRDSGLCRHHHQH